MDETQPEVETRIRRAEVNEAANAALVGLCLALPVVLLVLLAATKSLGVWTDGYAGIDAGSGYWSRSLGSIVLILAAAQLVSLLIACEHLVTSRRGLIVWLVRIAIVLLIAASILSPLPPTWRELAIVSAALEVLVVVLLWEARRTARAELSKLGDPPEPGVPAYPRLTVADERIVAIGASGGGIRAASFVLGGHQAVQTAAAADQPAPPVFAVSGGSYMASAIALRRTYDADGDPRVPPSDWRTAYDADSPELERLRRNTRYLFEPSWRTWDGIVSLLVGAAANLILVAACLRFVTWLSAQIAATTGLIRTVRDGRHIVLLEFAPGWDIWQWTALMAVPILCVLGVVLVTAGDWAGYTSFAREEDKAAQDRGIRWIQAGGAARVVLLGVATGWLLLAVGLPAAVYGVTKLMTSNGPTATAATVLDTAGFGVESLCGEAMARNVIRTVNEVNDDARLSPGEQRSRTAGACGYEALIVRQMGDDVLVDLPPYDYDWMPRDGEAPRSPYVVGSGPVRTEVADEEAKEALETRARELVGSHRVEGQIAAIGAALLFVIGLLRRGPSPDAATASTTRWSRVRRFVMTWLPVTIMAVIAVYLALLWTFRYLIRVNDVYLMWSAIITAVAAVLAYLVDANATSMHGFYRARLSSAFAVGVDDEAGTAKELAFEKVYRFSELPETVPLHVVTTLNSQAANEAPTRRGGFPMVFGPGEVRVHRERRRTFACDTEAYENYAGAGQVSVMAAVGMSGAAISPLMGRYGAQMAPYRLLLTLFNLRVGVWVRNPEHTRVVTDADKDERRFTASLLWLTRKPGLAQMVLEAAGSSSADRRWVYLSDGGHLDNTGLVECVRHCSERGRGGRVLVLDASNDAAGSWSAVSDALSVIRSDLGISLHRKPIAGDPPWARRYQCEDGIVDVLVVKAVRAEPPRSRNDTDWHAELPPDVAAFQDTHADFPRAATLRQKFGDLEFEAYRELGRYTTLRALELVDWA